MAGDLDIRPARSQDLANLIGLYRHLGHDDAALEPAVASQRLATILDRTGMTVFIGFVQDLPAATATLVIIPNLTRGGRPYALIENVVTHADQRRRGFGARLIHHAVEVAWQTDCYKVMLLTGSTEPSTLRFYGNCGFDRSKTGFQIRRDRPQ